MNFPPFSFLLMAPLQSSSMDPIDFDTALRKYLTVPRQVEHRYASKGTGAPTFPQGIREVSAAKIYIHYDFRITLL